MLDDHSVSITASERDAAEHRTVRMGMAAATVQAAERDRRGPALRCVRDRVVPAPARARRGSFIFLRLTGWLRAPTIDACDLNRRSGVRRFGQNMVDFRR